MPPSKRMRRGDYDEDDDDHAIRCEPDEVKVGPLTAADEKDFRGPARACVPTAAPAGSEEKVRVMEERYARRQNLFHWADATDRPTLAFTARAFGNGSGERDVMLEEGPDGPHPVPGQAERPPHPGPRKSAKERAAAKEGGKLDKERQKDRERKRKKRPPKRRKPRG